MPIWNRLPASFNTDSYVLQNVDHNSARDHGMDLVLERPFDGRWGMMIGATAHKSEGIGGNRGYLVNENDQGVIGEIFSDANAQTNSRGRVFFERGYVVKWSAMYQLPYGIRGGSVARYQDGQHFSRVVIARGLNQGIEFVPALPRGLTRFTYTFTLDTRLEKQLPVGGRRAAVDPRRVQPAQHQQRDRGRRGHRARTSASRPPSSRPGRCGWGCGSRSERS